MPATAPHATEIDPRHRENRERMAARLVAHLRATGDEVLTDPNLLSWLPKARLDRIAAEAGERHVPSWDTWRIVVQRLAQPAPVPCTVCPFAGLPT